MPRISIKPPGWSPRGMMKKVLSMPNEPRLGGFTDAGEISYLVPTMGIAMPTAPDGVPLHT